MAMPQNLNFPRIITVGIVGVLLLATTVVGTMAFYNYWNWGEEERKWTLVPQQPRDVLRNEQISALEADTGFTDPNQRDVAHLRLGQAMQVVIDTRGKIPATQPATAPVKKDAGR